MIITKDYLGDEAKRNKTHAKLYTEILQTAYGCDNDVLIGHHICFEHDHNIETENEIPAADTLIFDHEIMRRAFGAMALIVMRECANVPADMRDGVLQHYWTAEKRNRDAATYAQRVINQITISDT